MKLDTEILIVGGGLNGPVLALALAQSGYSCIVIDALPASVRGDPAFDGRSYALALASKRMLAALGVWQRVALHAQPILHIKVSDGRAGEGASPLHLHFDHNDIEEGPMGFMVEDRFLRSALSDTLAEHSLVKVISGAKVSAQAVSQGSVSVTLDDGRILHGQVLIGCDGRNSGVAQRAGILRTGWGYDQTSLVCAVGHELPHNGVAHQFFVPSGPLAILPLPGNVSSIVWTESSARAAEILVMDDAGFLAALRPVFGDFLGKVTLVGQRYSYPLGLSLAQSLTAPRVALAGDAAHGIHPLAGQGLNLGLRDVAALVETLVEAGRLGLDVGASDVLEGYARWRRADIAALAGVTDGVNRLFSNDDFVVRAVRDFGLGLVNSLPGLRRGLIREAAGLSGDLPRLMQ
jgi:2-octaprenyl-6-methoxyphenol hydroxylase